MCLADFVSHDGDWIGGFSVAIHGIEPHLARFKAAHDDYNDILLKALADRFAEAFAERLHAHVRTDLWGYAPGEQLTPEAIVKEEYRGIRRTARRRVRSQPENDPVRHVARGHSVRYAASFASCDRGGVGFNSHPDASYFGVSRVGPDRWTIMHAGGVDMDTATRVAAQ